jgi:hypothetical protein
MLKNFQFLKSSLQLVITLPSLFKECVPQRPLIPFLAAAAQGDHVAVTRFIQAGGIDLNQIDTTAVRDYPGGYRQTALHLAVIHAHECATATLPGRDCYKVMELLLAQHGFDRDKVDAVPSFVNLIFLWMMTIQF